MIVFFFFFFLPMFFFLPFFNLIFLISPLSSLFFPILPYFFPNFLTRKGGMLLDAIFSPRILFFFFTHGGRGWGENFKKPIFFLVLTITPELKLILTLASWSRMWPLPKHAGHCPSAIKNVAIDTSKSDLLAHIISSISPTVVIVLECTVGWCRRTVTIYLCNVNQIWTFVTLKKRIVYKILHSHSISRYNVCDACTKSLIQVLVMWFQRGMWKKYNYARGAANVPSVKRFGQFKCTLTIKVKATCRQDDKPCL